MMDHLAREAPPPPALKTRVVASLEQRGLLAPRRVRRIVAHRVAAAVALLAVGTLLGSRLNGAPDPDSVAGPKYLLVLYEDESFQPDRPAQELVAEYTAWAATPRSAGSVAMGEQLSPDGWMIDDVAPGDTPPAAGPYGEATGFFIITAPDDDVAREIARTCPHVRYGGRIAVRPIAGP